MGVSLVRVRDVVEVESGDPSGDGVVHADVDVGSSDKSIALSPSSEASLTSGNEGGGK